MPDIERSAAQAFRQIPELSWIAADAVQPAEWHLRLIVQGTCWVAVDRQDIPIGFLSAEVFGRYLHIWELSVRYDRQRSGVGKTLIEQAVSCARDRKLDAVTLTTFREVDWNERFYESLGFQVLSPEETDSRLNTVLRHETELGLPGRRRCAMRLSLV